MTIIKLISNIKKEKLRMYMNENEIERFTKQQH